MWTEDRLTLFRELWDSGKPFSVIGKELGASRSSIASVARRLGLRRPRPKLAPEERAARKRTRNRSYRARQAVQPVKVEIIPDLPFLNLTYDELNPFRCTEPNQCRYIPGDDYRYCGQETLPGESWCASCKRIVYQPRGAAPDRYHWRGF